MVIKDAKKHISKGSGQKKNKMKKTILPVVIDDDAQAGQLAKAKGEKKKNPVEKNNPKKKKKLDCKLKDRACIDLPITIQRGSVLELINEEAEPPRVLKKKRKRGLSCERESSPEIPSRGQTTECQEANDYNTKRRKKKKQKLACTLIQVQAEDDYSKKDLTPTMKTISHEMLSGRKRTLIQNAGSKRKKKKKNNWEEEEEEVDLLLTSAGNPENHPAISTEVLWKIKSESKQEKTSPIQNSGGDGKGPKKKKICTRVTNDCLDLLERNEDGRRKIGAVERARKRVQKSRKGQDGAASGEASGKQRHAKKRKARKNKGGEGGLEAEPSSKQAKAKKEAKKREDEIQVAAVKKGNCDESGRQVLLEKTDRASSKTKSAKEEGDSDRHFGQWSTATFDSAERKAKFLRLLGGFKTGPASTQEASANLVKHNMALTRHGEEKLQQTLQAEFEKAAGWKQRRGAGLGFQPVHQKRMSIDKNASRSIKFEV